jgi:hypothetical protein
MLQIIETGNNLYVGAFCLGTDGPGLCILLLQESQSHLPSVVLFPVSIGAVDDFSAFLTLFECMSLLFQCFDLDPPLANRIFQGLVGLSLVDVLFLDILDAAFTCGFVFDTFLGDALGS